MSRAATRVQLGVAYSPYVLDFLRLYPDEIDFVEVSFENLLSNPSIPELLGEVPQFLHSASMSLAGFVDPPTKTLESLKHWVEVLDPPWVGEHLAFTTAHGVNNRNGQHIDTGYSINPAMNLETVYRVVENVTRCEEMVSVPVLLENGAMNFVPPGSTLSYTEFISEICERSTADLILDLGHFLISCLNSGQDPSTELLELPLERIAEVHISGVSYRNGDPWDDHTIAAPNELYDLLGLVLARVSPAITLEYNWSMRFPVDELRQQIKRSRGFLSALQLDLPNHKND